MRSRRSKGVREPLKWNRASMTSILDVAPDDTAASAVVLVDGSTLAGFTDDQHTIRRVIVDAFPVWLKFDLAAGGFQSYVPQLRWWVIIEDQNTSLPGTPVANFYYDKGTDILAQGVVQALVSNGTVVTTSIVPVWSGRGQAGGPWLDIRVARKIHANEQMLLVMEASLACDVVLAEGDPGDSHWCVQTDIAYLFQRTMRKR